MQRYMHKKSLHRGFSSPVQTKFALSLKQFSDHLTSFWDRLSPNPSFQLRSLALRNEHEPRWPLLLRRRPPKLWWNISKRTWEACLLQFGSIRTVPAQRPRMLPPARLRSMYTCPSLHVFQRGSLWGTVVRQMDMHRGNSHIQYKSPY